MVAVTVICALCFFVVQNLDVNLAVNNLLSRDDEGEDDLDDSGDPYMSGWCLGLKSVQNRQSM